MSLENFCTNAAIEVTYRCEVLGLRLDVADVGTIGLLVGLMEEKSNLVGMELRRLQILSSQLIEQREIRINQDLRDPSEVFLASLSEKQRVLREALFIRHQMSHGGTHAEHIFLSAVNCSRGAQDVLSSLGVDWRELRNDVVTGISNNPMFKPVPSEARTLDGGNIYRSSYMGILIGVCSEIKHNMAKRLKDESNQETRSSLLQELIQELSQAEEKAAKLESKFGRRSV